MTFYWFWDKKNKSIMLLNEYLVYELRSLLRFTFTFFSCPLQTRIVIRYYHN